MQQLSSPEEIRLVGDTNCSQKPIQVHNLRRVVRSWHTEELNQPENFCVVIFQKFIHGFGEYVAWTALVVEEVLKIFVKVFQRFDKTVRPSRLRVVNLDLQGEQFRPLLIDLATNFSRNIFIELVLDELIDGLVDARIYLVLDVFGNVLKYLIFEGLLEQLPYFLLFRGLGRAQYVKILTDPCE